MLYYEGVKNDAYVAAIALRHAADRLDAAQLHDEDLGFYGPIIELFRDTGSADPWREPAYKVACECIERAAGEAGLDRRSDLADNVARWGVERAQALLSAAARHAEAEALSEAVRRQRAANRVLELGEQSAAGLFAQAFVPTQTLDFLSFLQEPHHD